MQITVSGERVQKQVTEVQRILRKIQAPEGPVVRDDKNNGPGIQRSGRSLNR